jgi:2-(1,2-epoxy-1,2-dihydrophenyl)acetyl-CoA isomerase
MSYQKIEVERRGTVGILRLNDPTKLNAFTSLMIEEMNLALDDLVSSVRAIILTGAGRAFSSGASLDGGLGTLADGRAGRDLGLVLEKQINPLMSRLRDLPIPWISAVRGAAAGVGASLAMAGDLVIASESAYFLQAFAKIGLVPDGGATHLLVRTIGRARTMELALLAERLPAAKALQWGLVNYVVADDVLDNEALSLAAKLADGPSVTYGLIRKAVWGAVDANWEEVLHTERASQKTAGQTLDYDEGVAAFLAKRAASFIGK